MNRNIRNQSMLRLAAGILLLMFYLTVNQVQASETTGNTLPYEDWLRTLQQSLTGPVAFSVALIGIVCCGATLIFAGGEIGRFMRSLIYIIMVMTMLIGANSLMTRFFNGASIGEVQEESTEVMAAAAAADNSSNLFANVSAELPGDVCSGAVPALQLRDLLPSDDSAGIRLQPYQQLQQDLLGLERKAMTV